MGIPGNTGVLVAKRADQCLSICTLSIIHGLGIVINRFSKKVLSYFYLRFYIEEIRFKCGMKQLYHCILRLQKNIRKVRMFLACS